MAFSNFDSFYIMGRLSLLGDNDLEVGVVGDGFHNCFTSWFEVPGDCKPVAFQKVEPTTTDEDQLCPHLGFISSLSH